MCKKINKTDITLSKEKDVLSLLGNFKKWELKDNGLKNPSEETLNKIGEIYFNKR